MPIQLANTTPKILKMMGLSPSSRNFAEAKLRAAGFIPREVHDANGTIRAKVWPKAAVQWANEYAAKRAAKKPVAEQPPAQPQVEPQGADTSHQPAVDASLANLLVRLEAKIDVLHERLEEIRDELAGDIEDVKSHLDDIEQSLGETEENVEILLDSLTEPEGA